MSAYVVDREHIVYLVEAALSHALAECDGGSISWLGPCGRRVARCTASAAERAAIGNMLWKENERSVRARYPDAAELPGPIGDNVLALTERDFARGWSKYDPVQVLQSIACYEYQTCETEDHEQTEAWSFCQSLRRKAIHALPGYDEAVWGAPARK